jgi:hypothetical protein
VRAPWLVVLFTASAHATPLEPLWETKYAGDCEHTYVVRASSQLIAADGRKLVRVDAASGKDLGKGKLGDPPPAAAAPGVGWGDDHPGVRFAVADVMLSTEDHGWIAYDAASGAARWRRDQEAGDSGIPRAQPVGSDGVLIVRPAFGARGPTIELVEAKTGKTRWRAVAGKEMRAWTGSDAERVYMATTPAVGARKGHLFAYELASGKLVYTVELAPPVNPAVVNTESQDIQDGDAELPDVIAIDGARLVLPVPGEGLRIYDARTGKETARVSATEVHRFGITGLVAGGGRAYFFIRRAASGPPDAIEAIDLDAKKVLWTQETDLGNWAEIHLAAALTLETDTALRSLDRDTGALQAEWGVAGSRVAYTSSDATAPAFVVCGDGKLTALDPSGKPSPPERAIIDGTLRCKGCGAGIKVSVGSVSTVTDKKGNFKLDVTARGALEVEPELPKTEAPMAWSGPHLHVRLTGKRTYHLGTKTYTLSNPEEE